MGCEGKEDAAKWIKHYSSDHHILLVGEGDFSFSLCLSRSFGSASNIVATSLDSYDAVITTYKKAKANLENLSNLGASTIHGVDATKMKFCTDLKMRKFDRIVFNFPHAGFHAKEDDIDLINMHKKLVLGFFNSARGMLRAYGEIHVTHKTSEPYCRWGIEELACSKSLELVECVDFKKQDYPGYNNKKGHSIRCDESFRLGESSTFKFRFFPTSVVKKNSKVTSLAEFSYCHEIAIQTCYHPNQLNNGIPHSSRNMNNAIERSRQRDLAFTSTDPNAIDWHLNVHPKPVGSRANSWDYQNYMAEPIGNQQGVGNPFPWQRKQVSFTSKVKAFLGRMEIGTALPRELSHNRQEWKRLVSRYGGQSEGRRTCDIERSATGALGRSLHGEVNNSNTMSELKQLVQRYGREPERNASTQFMSFS